MRQNLRRCTVLRSAAVLGRSNVQTSSRFQFDSNEFRRASCCGSQTRAPDANQDTSKLEARQKRNLTHFKTGDWKVPRTRRQECRRYVAQAFQSRTPPHPAASPNHQSVHPPIPPPAHAGGAGGAEGSAGAGGASGDWGVADSSIFHTSIFSMRWRRLLPCNSNSTSSPTLRLSSPMATGVR